jgi:hypothetical protein
VLRDRREGSRNFARVEVVAACVVCAVLALWGTPALAAPPVVEAESFSDVGSSSAMLSAKINAGGSLSEYQFEYAAAEEESCFATRECSKTPLARLGSASTGVSVLAQVGGLKSEAIYHFRVVATHAGKEPGEGDIVAFTTFPVGLLGLPDGRGYEMVSPVTNADGNVYEPTVNPSINGLEGAGDNTQRPFEASADGNAMTYLGDSSATSGTGKQGHGYGNQYLATRAPAGGWGAVNIEPAAATIFEDPIFEAFSSDLSIGLLNYDGQNALVEGAPGSTYNILYVRANADASYSALVTATPPNRDAEEFGTYETLRHGVSRHPVAYAGASSTFAHVLFLANDALPSSPESVDGGAEANNLYDSSGGQLRLVNVLPNGTPAPNAIFGAPIQPSEETGEEDSPDFSHVISADGSRIFWTDLTTHALYVRENDTTSGAVTVQVDAVEPGAPGSSGGGRFWTASSDGSKVFFTDESRLTSDSTAAPNAPDLYEYDVQDGHLTDLTVDGNPGEHANVQGVVGASEDGSYVYFVAGGVLASGASPQSCEPENESTGCNLYVLHEGQAPKLIATLSVADNRVQPFSLNSKVFGDWRPGLGNRTAEVTPDGKHLVFMSLRNLTGYESDQRQEVYLYDIEANGGEGGRSCVSCNPSGQPPAGTYPAFVQPSFSNTYLPRWVSRGGTRVFFDSTEALVPQDTNNRLDVYEWERSGTGSCRRQGGCLYVLSGGTSSDNSYLADASESGDDVFFVTRAQLVSTDSLETYKLYDARVGAVQPPAESQCAGFGCQGVSSAPPIFATPASVTFNGVGNFPPPPPPPVVKPKTLTRAQRLAKALSACRKEPKRKRAACKKQAQKRYGPAKSRSKKAARSKTANKTTRGRK